eukprot:6195389-Pleurochrysis_carterae.AAC.2
MMTYIKYSTGPRKRSSAVCVRQRRQQSARPVARTRADAVVAHGIEAKTPIRRGPEPQHWTDSTAHSKGRPQGCSRAQAYPNKTKRVQQSCALTPGSTRHP